MKLKRFWGILIIPLMALIWLGVISLFKISGFADANLKRNAEQRKEPNIKEIGDSVFQLPMHSIGGKITLEQSLTKRKSVRTFRRDTISSEDLSQILWAAYGITDTSILPGIKLRTVHSVGSVYPLVIYLVAGEIKYLHKGLYRYIPENNSLKCLVKDNIRAKLYEATDMNEMILEAPMLLIIIGDSSVTKDKLYEYSEKQVYMEAGQSFQNIQLQATVLGLGSNSLTKFETEKVSSSINLAENEYPICIVPVGRSVSGN